MELFNTIEAKKAINGDDVLLETPGGSKESHFEALDFFQRHRDFLEHYAKGSVKIEPAPEGLRTFAFNLETNTVYVNSMFYGKRNFSEEKTLFAICHELEHFSEKKAMLEEDGGEKRFEKYLERIKTSRAFALMDNCNGDIRENRAVIARTNAGMQEVEEKMYREDLFAETDFTQVPKHIQFCQAFLRENRILGEKCQVSADVRSALDQIANVKGLLDVMTNPETPMLMRLKLQEKYLWPKIQELLEKDIEDKKKKQQEEKEEGEGQNEENGQGENEEGQQQENGEDQAENDQQAGSGNGEKKSSKKKGENKSSESSNRENGDEKGDEEEVDPDKIFADEYEKAEKNFPEAVSTEEIETAFKQWKESHNEKNDSADGADEDYARKIGVEKKDLQEYRKLVDSLERISNPQTNVGVFEDLRNIFSRIISKRIKKAQAPKYPVEDGDEIVDPAQLVADVKAGNLKPKVWEDIEIKEKRGDRFGEVEITLVCDRSGSMQNGQRALEQRKCTVLVMEALKEFSELCEDEKINIDKPLNVKSEVYGFGAGEDKTPMKKMSTELGEAERIKIFKDLHHLPGSTTDFNCLEAILNGIDDDVKNKIKEGELKKIIIILTDGESDNPARVRAILQMLRSAGVIAVGVGITKDGQAVLSSYAPNAQVVEDVSRLPVVVGDLLKEHLKDI